VTTNYTSDPNAGGEDRRPASTGEIRELQERGFSRPHPGLGFLYPQFEEIFGTSLLDTGKNTR
jgi:hypothetical protein